MSKTEYIQRTYDFEMRASPDEQGIIEGRPIIFESKTDLGWFDEIVHRGALDKTNMDDVRFIVNHNTDMIPLARSRKGDKNSTMQLTVDKDGLKIRLKLDIENNTDAKNLYSALQRGDISGMSFMFSINGQSWTDEQSDHPTRHIDDIGEILEVSAVTFPAYKETEINARKKEELSNMHKMKRSEEGKQGTKDRPQIDLEIEKIKTKILGGMA
jgi:HK97 family phage prohead protease